MTDLFDSKDILTVATADQAVVGTKGYFCDGLQSLAIKIKQSDVGTLASVDQDNAYCFKNYNGVSYIFFLPVDKAKKFNIYIDLSIVLMNSLIFSTLLVQTVFIARLKKLRFC